MCGGGGWGGGGGGGGGGVGVFHMIKNNFQQCQFISMEELAKAGILLIPNSSIIALSKLY